MTLFGNEAARNIFKKCIIQINSTVVPIVDSSKSIGLQLDRDLRSKKYIFNKLKSA